jgi:hypothetical protein
MKTNKLKPLIKTVLKEMYKKQLNEASSGTFDDYEIEFDSLVIPGLTTDADGVIVTVSFEYDSQPGTEAKGMFGPPEKSSPAESSEVNLIDWDFVSVTITSEQGQHKEINNFSKLSREQFETLKTAVNDYIQTNKDKIEDEILEKEGNNDQDFPDTEDNYFEDK